MITIIDIATLVALFLGPIAAIVIANCMETKRATRNRRMDVFRTLMRTRRNRLTIDHVSALNLVEIEFQKDKKVITAWRTYFEHLGTEQPRRSDEAVSQNSNSEEKTLMDERYNSRIRIEREKLLAALLSVIARNLDYSIESLDIFEGGYTPQAWADIEFQQEAIRQYVIDLYLGNKALPVLVFQPNTDSKKIDSD